MSFLDIIMLEKVYHPLNRAYEIGWENFYVSSNFQFIWWHVAFIPLVIILFLMLGFALGSWKMTATGIIAFATGWEDIFYYVLQGSWLPAELPWLNWSPIMALTRPFSSSGNVTGVGVTITAILGAIVIWIILKEGRLTKKLVGKDKKS